MAEKLLVTLVNGELQETYTQYQIIRDHINLIYYITNSNNMNLRAIQMKQLDFSREKILYASIENDYWFLPSNNTLKQF